MNTELLSEIQLTKLQTAAKIARAKAYAPYSKFQVGASLMTPNGNLYNGCNVENASYGLTFCAEANAIAHMILAGEQKISQILVVASSDDICYPCGACRQRIAEFATPTTLIVCCNQQLKIEVFTLQELLPHVFYCNKLVPSVKSCYPATKTAGPRS